MFTKANRFDEKNTNDDVPGPGQYNIKETVPSMDEMKNFGFLNKSKRFISPKSETSGLNFLGPNPFRDRITKKPIIKKVGNKDNYLVVKINQLTMENNYLQEQCNEKENSINQLKNQLNTILLDNNKNTKGKKDIIELNLEVDNLKKKNLKLKNDSENWREMVKEKELEKKEIEHQMNIELNNSKIKISSFEKQIFKYKEQLKSAFHKNQENENLISELKLEYENLKKQKSSNELKIQDENLKLKKNLQTVNEQKERLSEKIERIEKQHEANITEMKKYIDILQEDNEKVLMEKSQIMLSNENLNREKITIQKDYDQMKEENQSYLNKREKVLQEKQILLDEKKKKDEEIIKLEKEVQEKNDEITEVKKILEQIKEELEYQEELNKKITEEKKTL